MPLPSAASLKAGGTFGLFAAGIGAAGIWGAVSSASSAPYNKAEAAKEGFVTTVLFGGLLFGASALAAHYGSARGLATITRKTGDYASRSARFLGRGAKQGWDFAGKLPFGIGKFGLVAAASIAGAAIARPHLVEPNYESVNYAAPSEMGYEYSDSPPVPEPTLGQRLYNLGGQGDLVFGLHNRRH